MISPDSYMVLVDEGLDAINESKPPNVILHQPR